MLGELGVRSNCWLERIGYVWKCSSMITLVIFKRDNNMLLEFNTNSVMIAKLTFSDDSSLVEV